MPRALLIQQNATSKSIEVEVFNGISGERLSGRVWNSAGLTAHFKKGMRTAEGAITLATLVDSNAAYSNGGFVEWRNGKYRLDIPNVALDTLGPVYISMRDDDGNTYVCEDVTVVPFDPSSSTVDADVKKVAGVAVDGAGTGGDPWGPA